MSKLIYQFNLALTVMLVTLGLTAIKSEPIFGETSSQYNSDSYYYFQLSQSEYSCHQIGEEYQEILTFETANFYVNICFMGDRYFYLGEAKDGILGSIFLPAYPLANERDYIANNGNISYLISSSTSENTLVIRKNGRQIIAERAFQLYYR